MLPTWRGQTQHLARRRAAAPGVRCQALAVIEAKRFLIDPYAAKDQARAYAQSLPVHFVILSNGNDHYFWDYADGDARPILDLPTQPDLERRAKLKQHRQGDLVHRTEVRQERILLANSWRAHRISLIEIHEEKIP